MNELIYSPPYNCYPQQTISLYLQKVCSPSNTNCYPQTLNVYKQSLYNNTYYHNDNRITNFNLSPTIPSIINSETSKIGGSAKTLDYYPIQNFSNSNQNTFAIPNNNMNQVPKLYNQVQVLDFKHCPREPIFSSSSNNNAQFHRNSKHVIYQEQNASVVFPINKNHPSPNSNQIIYYGSFFDNTFNENKNDKNNADNNNKLLTNNTITNVVSIPGFMAYSNHSKPVIPSTTDNTKGQLKILFENEYMSTNNQKNFLKNEKHQRQIKIISAASPLWTLEEDKLLRKLKEEKNLGWRDISMYFPSRTINACQFRWRRIIEKEKNKFKRGLIKLDKIKSNFPEEIQKFSDQK